MQPKSKRTKINVKVECTNDIISTNEEFSSCGETLYDPVLESDFYESEDENWDEGYKKERSRERKVKKPLAIEPVKKLTVKKEIDQSKNLKCPVCCYTATTKKMFKSHIATHPDDDFNKPTFKSSFCGGIFKSVASQKFHDGTHHSVNTYRCNICEFQTKYNGKLKKHNLCHSSTNLGHDCHICDATFDSKQGLDRHMINAHNKEKGFKCKHCNFKSGNRQNLKLHEKIHERQLPADTEKYPCNFCDLVFKSSSARGCHQTSYHGAEKTMYSCPVEYCNYKTKSILDIKRHGKIHDPSNPGKFSCEVCGAKLVNKFNMRYHMKACHGEGLEFHK